MKRADVLVMGGAMFAASGALVLLDTAVTSVSEPPFTHPPAAAVAAPEPAFTLPSVPGTSSGVFESESKQVPLPPGNWVTMRRVVAPVGPVVGDGNAPVVSTVLVRLHGHRVDAAMLVQVNPPNSTSHWGLARGCERQDFYYAQVLYSSDHDGACSYVTYVTPWAASAPMVDDAWRLSMQDAVDNGWDVPQQWLEAVYRVTDPVDALQVRYLFDPAQGEPLQKEITEDEVARLVGWSRASWPAVQSGFRGRLKPGRGDGLAAWTAVRVEPVPPWQHAKPPPPLDRAALKTLSYQMVGSLTNFAVTYAYLGSLAAASTLSVAASVVSGAMIYVEDLAWSFVPDPARPWSDLPGAGLEQPGPAGS